MHKTVLATGSTDGMEMETASIPLFTRLLFKTIRLTEKGLRNCSAP